MNDHFARARTYRRAGLASLAIAVLLGVIAAILWPAPPQAPTAPTEAEVLPRVSVTPGAGGVDGHPGACYPDVEPWERCTGRGAHWVVFDRDPASGKAECIQLVKGTHGEGCTVAATNLDPHGGPGRYVEYDDVAARGVEKCVNDLRHDLNLGAVCEVVPTSRELVRKAVG